MSYVPLHHKYRPKTFAQLVGQEAIATTLSNAIRTAKIAPAYLFTGPRGTGKTSSARILAKSLNCLSSPVPTPEPCGVCDVCQGINKGNILDVIEIDAASNTGVDNVRDIIERAQYAPVQCRYKVYVIDECLSGDSLVLTSEGHVRIDDPKIKGKKVLSYNDSTGNWEYKKVLRWLDRGEKETLLIKTTNSEIRCTGNHLIKIDRGWIPAREVKEGMRILSPGNAGFVRTTNFAVVKSVRLAGIERVYDIEVESNHNFVANGLLVHNCHMLSTQAFNALLKTLEEPPQHVVFVLATTDPQRVLSTIISRCQRFDFRRIPIESMVKHLTDIASKESINISSQAITLVAQLSQGGLRDAESLLDQLGLLEGEVVPERVWDLVGSVSEPDLLALLSAITTDNPEVVLDCARKILDRGREPLIILQNFASFYRDLLIAKTAPSRQDLVAYTPEIWQSLCQISHKLDIGTILAGQERLRASEVQLKNSTQPRLWLEITLLGLLPSANQIGHFNIVSNGASNNSPNARPVSPNPVNHNPQPYPSPSSPSPPPPPPLPVQDAPTQQPQPTYQNGTNGANVPKIVNESNGTNRNTSPAALSTPVSPAPKQDLVQIWQQVLSNLQPIPRRSLLNQMCRLLDFDGKVARLAIKQAWYKKVQTDINIITSAFRITFQSDIQVHLEIANSSAPARFAKEAPNTPLTHPKPTQQLPTQQLPTSPTTEYNPPKEEAEQPVNPIPIKNEPPPTNVVQPTALVPATPIVPHIPEPPPSPPIPEEPPPLDRQAEEVINAAKNLAEFFFGQIVGLDDGKEMSTDSVTAEFVEEVDADDDF